VSIRLHLWRTACTRLAAVLLFLAIANAQCIAQINPAAGEWVFKEYLIDGHDAMAGIVPPKKGLIAIDTGYYLRVKISKSGNKVDITFTPGPDSIPPAGGFGSSDVLLAPTYIRYRTDKPTEILLPNSGDVFVAETHLTADGFTVFLTRKDGTAFATETWAVAGAELTFQVDYANPSKLCRRKNDCFEFKQSKRIYANKNKQKLSSKPSDFSLSIEKVAMKGPIAPFAPA
jgi:hypothetical protein